MVIMKEFIKNYVMNFMFLETEKKNIYKNG